MITMVLFTTERGNPDTISVSSNLYKYFKIIGLNDLKIIQKFPYVQFFIDDVPNSCLNKKTVQKTTRVRRDAVLSKREVCSRR